MLSHAGKAYLQANAKTSSFKSTACTNDKSLLPFVLGKAQMLFNPPISLVRLLHVVEVK